MSESTTTSLLHRASFASMNGLIEALSADIAGWTPDEKTLSMLSDLPLSIPLSPPYDAERSPTSASSQEPPAPKRAKRVHALHELLSSERAYASDLALTRDIHIPMASGAPHSRFVPHPGRQRVAGQPAPIHVALPTPPTSSGSSARTLSTASDSSTQSALGPPMTREDIKIIFGNIAELAVFSDALCTRIEAALGSALDGGTGEDQIGALFLDIVRRAHFATPHPR